jgi:hypothetical protein
VTSRADQPKRGAATFDNAAMDPPGAPRFALGWAMLICAIATLLLAYPALSGGFLVNPASDQYIAGYAFREFAADMLRSQGQFPLWNPYLFGGLPYVAAMHGDIFYPTFLLRLILPTDIAMTWGMILHVWLAGVASYAFFRSHGLSFPAALAGGVAYMMSGMVAGLVSPGHDGKLFITALFPLTLLVLRAGIRGGKPWAWGVLALVVGLGVLSPHPQLLQYLLLCSGAYALWIAFAEGGADAPTQRQALTRLALAAAALLVGFAIGAIQFLPVREYTAWSPRAAGHDWETATSYSMPPEEIINTLLPQFSGILDNYWGRNPIHLHSEYIGFPVIMLAAAAFGTGDQTQRRWRWFWLGVLIISAFWAFGGFTPFYHIPYALVPGTKFFRAPSTIMFESAFAIAALAAIGMDRLLTLRLHKRFFAIAISVLSGMALLGLSGALLDMFGQLSPRPEAVEANRAAVSLGAARMFVFGGAAIVLAFALSRRRMRASVGAWLFLALITVDLWSVERIYWMFSPRAARIFATDPIVERIRSDSVQGRVFTIQLAPGAAYRDPYLGGDAFMVHRVRHITGYHGNGLARYDTVWRAGLYGHGMTAQGVLEGLASPAFAQFTNLRWLYTNTGDIPPPFERVLGPVRNAVGSDVWLYRVPGDNPQAWVVPAIMKASAEQTIATMLGSDVSHRVGLFEPDAPVEAVQLTSAPDPLALRANVTHFEPGAMSVELDAPAPAGSALIVSENFYPGWTAVIDGKAALAVRADYTLIGVPLPEGSRRIDLRFDSPPYRTGKTVTLLALLTAATAAMVGAVLRRRGSRG